MHTWHSNEPLILPDKNVSKFDPEEEIQTSPGTTEREWVKLQKRRAVLEPSPCSYTTVAQGMPPQNSFCFLNYCSEFLTGNRGRCLGFHAMALPGYFTFFQNEPGKLNTKCMYCCITHPSQTSQLIGVNGVTSYLFSWNEGKRTEIPRLRSASWS